MIGRLIASVTAVEPSVPSVTAAGRMMPPCAPPVLLPEKAAPSERLLVW